MTQTFNFDRLSLVDKAPFRYTTLKAWIEKEKGAEAAEFFRKEIHEVAERTCATHGLLKDPGVLVGTLSGESESRFVVVCPRCASPELRVLWEAEA